MFFFFLSRMFRKAYLTRYSWTKFEIENSNCLVPYLYRRKILSRLDLSIRRRWKHFELSSNCIDTIFFFFLWEKIPKFTNYLLKLSNSPIVASGFCISLILAFGTVKIAAVRRRPCVNVQYNTSNKYVVCAVMFY